MPKIPNTALAPVPEPQTLTAEKTPHDNARLQSSIRHCSNCKGPSHNKLQCPSRPCNFCNNLGHVSMRCPIRQGINTVKCRKSRAKFREKQSLLKRQRKRLEIWLNTGESPYKEASASKILLTAADQPVRIEAEVEVEITKDQLHDPVHGTSDTNTKSAEDMELVR